jgi:hypothetical protein
MGWLGEAAACREEVGQLSGLGWAKETIQMGFDFLNFMDFGNLARH